MDYLTSDDKAKMREEIDWRLKIGVYTRAELWIFDEEAKEWSGAEEFQVE